MRRLLVRDSLSELNSRTTVTRQRSAEYLDWIDSDLIGFVNEFIQENKLLETHFIKSMSRTFNTTRFEPLLKKWLVEYLERLFRILDGSSGLILEDNPINRFGVEKYYARFGALPEIRWKNNPSLYQKIFSILVRPLVVLYISLNRGVKFCGKRKRYKVMREALWGLYNVGGYYFHDDFLVDGDKIKKEDLLLFSRGIPEEEGRLKGYHDAKKSPYAHFNLSDISIGIRPLFLRIIPKYIILSSLILFKEINSTNFSLYWSIYLNFKYSALSYEKIFSHFEIISELGHNCFTIDHIAEAIICQHYGTKYYVINWSDLSININNHMLSFLGCDGVLLWGRAHITRMVGESHILMPTGYPFKRFIKEIMSNRGKILSDMGIAVKGKIISFFDESFGGECKMTEENYITLWETAFRLAQIEGDSTILIKPKSLVRYHNLSDGLKRRFIDVKNKIEKIPNIYIIDENRWSFIECIGVSDIVVTQGMTSSATIAIICGIEGLYLDQAQYSHPFSRLFKDRIVFDDPEKLLSMIRNIISGREQPLKNIPEDILRFYDAYPDNRGIDLLRNILVGYGIQKRVGIIIQARMGSTRLPGKIMKTILGRPMLEILIERLKRTQKPDMLVIATTRNKNDDVVERLATRLGVSYFRGDEEDVLSRYYEAAKEYSLDVIVRITADCPLADPRLIDALIENYLENGEYDYISNTVKRMFPRGYDMEVFNFKALEKAEKNARAKYQREHVTPYMQESMKTKNFDNIEDASAYRLTVDTIEDFELINSIFEEFKYKPDFGYNEVIELLKKRPELGEINKYIRQKETANLSDSKDNYL